MTDTNGKTDFEHFLQKNRDKLYASAEKAEDIQSDDPWMQEGQWDNIYAREKVQNHMREKP